MSGQCGRVNHPPAFALPQQTMERRLMDMDFDPSTGMPRVSRSITPAAAAHIFKMQYSTAEISFTRLCDLVLILAVHHYGKSNEKIFTSCIFQSDDGPRFADLTMDSCNAFEIEMHQSDSIPLMMTSETLESIKFIFSTFGLMPDSEMDEILRGENRMCSHVENGAELNLQDMVEYLKAYMESKSSNVVFH